MQQCIIYARTASSDAGQLGIQMQVAACREYAQQKGWNVIAVYEDAGISGNTRKRQGLRDALKCLKTHPSPNFLVYSLDRLARDLELTLELVKEIEANGSIAVVTASHVLIQLASQLIAQMDRKAFTERVRRGKQIARERRAAQNQ